MVVSSTPSSKPSDNIDLRIETSGTRGDASEERQHLVQAITKLGKARDFGQAAKLNRMETAALMQFITELTMQNSVLAEQLDQADKILEDKMPKKKMWTPFSGA